MVKNSRMLLLAGFLFVSLVLAGCGKGANPSNQGPGGRGAGVPVALEEVKRGDIQKELLASGQLMGEQSVVVSPRISGRVASVRVDVGTVVKAGDVLFTLDNSDIQAQVRQAEAVAMTAREKMKVAQQNRDNAEKQYQRNKVLFEQGVISAEAYESFALKLAQARSGEPEAALAQAEAALSYQLNQLANTVITAPISGTVAQRSVEVGGMVSSATQAVSLVYLDRMKVQVNVGEEHVSKIQQGQNVRVVVPAAGRDAFTGTISGVSPASDAKTKSFPVEVRLDNPGKVLKQGMFAEVYFIAGRSENALVIPVDAVVTRNNEQVVFTVEEGAAKLNKVKLGISDGIKTEVIEGLAEGQKVVIIGHQALVDGSKVMAPGAQGRQGGQGGPPGEGGQRPPEGQPKGER